MPKDAPLAVEVPASHRDSPGWVKVGVIAAVGFVIGIAWPRLVGVRLGPAAPGEAAAAAASAAASTHASRAPEAPSSSPAASIVAKVAPSAVAIGSAARPGSSGAPATAALPPTITVQKGSVLSCKTADGETKKGKECGPVPGLDLLVNPRIRKIGTCSGVEGQTGKLSLIVNADFTSGRLSYDIGKSSSLPNLDAVTSCLKTSFHGTSTKETTHEHSRYTVVYTTLFADAAGADPEDKVAHKERRSDEKAKEAKDEKDERGEKTEKADALPSGEAAVAWEVALVRDAPKTGALVSRLPRGSKVRVGTPKDGWYQIKFGDNFANEGWVYRGAIGR